MRIQLLLLLAVACGYPESTPLEVVKQEAVRCTSETGRPEWECCDDDSLKCGNGALVVCVAHQWQGLSAAHCEAIAASRPDLNAYGTLCDAATQRDTCPMERQQ